MIYLYDFIIFFYSILIKISSFFSKKGNKLYIGRKKIPKYFVKKNISKEKKIWIHISSLGEFEQAKPLIHTLKTKSNYKIFVTFFSPSAEKSVREYSMVDYSCYLPEDSSKKMEMMYKNINPKILLIIKYEFWYHLIREGNKINIPIISVSSNFRKDQIYFRNITFFSKILKNINQFYVQNTNSKKLLKAIQINSCLVVGDTRFDRVFEIYKEARVYPKIKKFIGNKKTIIIGSSWKSDLNKIYKTINKNNSLKYIIAPHNVNQNECLYIENLFPKKTIRYSLLNEKKINKKNILIIDNTGMLSSLYRYGNIAYIGGAFEGALHNTLEAAVWNLPVLFGDHKSNKKFNEVNDLENLNYGFSINTSKEFEKEINKLLKDKIKYYTKKYIIKNTGATKKIYKSIKKFLK